jgi:hypothetical protein
MVQCQSVQIASYRAYHGSRRFVLRTPHTTMTVSDGKVTQKSVQNTLFVRHGIGENT